jgi:hypothetical protein
LNGLERDRQGWAGGIYTFAVNLIPMESISPELKKEVFRRKDQLERVKNKLKREFA